MFKENSKSSAPESTIGGNNRIVSGTKIKGEVNSQSDFRIDGEVEGTIQTTGRVVVGKTGIIKGKVICTNADVEGTIQGTLQVQNTLSLKSTARIEGEVLVEKLAIEPGAVFNVTCSMGKEKSVAQPLFNKESKSVEKADK